MQTITVEITNNSALKTIESLANKHFISIIDKAVFDSPALPGKPLSLSEFKNWINDAEAAPSISFNDAQSKWAKKKSC